MLRNEFLDSILFRSWRCVPSRCISNYHIKQYLFFIRRKSSLFWVSHPKIVQLKSEKYSIEGDRMLGVSFNSKTKNMHSFGVIWVPTTWKIPVVKFQNITIDLIYTPRHYKTSWPTKLMLVTKWTTTAKLLSLSRSIIHFSVNVLVAVGSPHMMILSGFCADYNYCNGVLLSPIASRNARQHFTEFR